MIPLGPPSPLIWPVQPTSSSPGDDNNVKLTQGTNKKVKSLVITIDKIDVDAVHSSTVL